MTGYIFVGEGGDESATSAVEVIMKMSAGRPCILRDIVEADVALWPRLKGVEHQYKALVIFD